ncbi:DedA family protein [Salsipaludibacter albus]|uniref:DedA family protein n=1 Tax=Salsipaludibacter albus TaxID=2849650 RepID=UPI001EE4969D|nr:VTT domain-containing protein [Salsipaludibacter albus]MBY5161017.1 VTT domain-containing protein [Salsipaludibacter albus]
MTTTPDPDGTPVDPGPTPAAASHDELIDESLARRWKRPLLWLAVARYLVPIMAIPFAPALIPDQMVLLTLVRPGKEILLAAGGIYRTNGNGEPDLLLLFLAFLPLMVGGVWVFFALGRAWQRELAADEGPQWLERLVPNDVLHQLQRLLEARGPMLAFLGRIAALPPTIMAAAAGTSNVDSRWYLVADFVGAIASFAITVGAGYALGEAYDRGGIWFTVIGVVLLVVIIGWATTWLRREPEPDA